MTFEEANEAFLRAVAARDPVKMAGFFAEDALAMYPSSQPCIGRAANQEAWADYFSHYDAHPLSVDAVTVAQSGELAYVLGRHASAETAVPGAWAGRYVAIWKRCGERWEITVLSAHQHDDVQPFPFSDSIQHAPNG